MSEYNQPEFKKERIDEEFYKDKIKEMIKEEIRNNEEHYKYLFKEILMEFISEGITINVRKFNNKPYSNIPDGTMF